MMLLTSVLVWSLSNALGNRFLLNICFMGKMYFPDEVQNKRASHAEEHKAYKRELTMVILIWVGAIVLIIIDIILLTKLL